MKHLFTVKGWIDRGTPSISWSISFIEGNSIDEAIVGVRKIFAEKVEITDVTRIITRDNKE